MANFLLTTAPPRIALSPRESGDGDRLARNGEGDWLAAAGTWFHADARDEAALLALYARSGIDAIARGLEGFFVLVIFDARAAEYSIVTDLMGSRHCFFRELDGDLAVSTSSLRLAGLAPAALDPTAVEEYLRTGVIYEERTLFREVRKLAPATIYRIVAGRIVERRPYWRFDDLETDAIEAAAAAERLAEALVAAAARIGRAFLSPVCDLTGGWDSRAIVAAFLRAGAAFEATVSGPVDGADVTIARRLAARAGISLLHLEPEPQLRIDDAVRLTDGEADPVEYARIAEIHRRTIGRFDVSINGSYGEIARGYWWELLWPRAGERRPIDARALAAKRYLTAAESPDLYPTGAGLDLVAHLAAILGRSATAERNTAQMDQAYLFVRMQRWQGRIASATDRIRPCLSPFMFRSVLEAALRTPPRLRRNNRLMRDVIHRLRPDLAAEPLESGAPALPLNWRTGPRFLPAAGVAAKKAWRRFAPPASAPPAPPARLRLWRDERIAATLAPATMLLGAVIDPARLQAFLAASRRAAFGFDAQWNRLLGLELALRSLAEKRGADL
ncbi:MAG: hypothetical protein SF339_01870 [Blastocatellia bacterium]|nr:hypothetical protein [Blastocatellia bacterium]